MSNAVYFDGWTAADRAVTVTLLPDGVQFDGIETPVNVWPYVGLESGGRRAADQPFPVAHRSQPGARLMIADDALAAALTARAPHLRRRAPAGRFGHGASWVAGLVAAIFAAGYLVLQLAPQPVAFMLPDSWRDHFGQQVEAALTHGAKQCSRPAARAAMDAMVARLAEGHADLPPLKVRVYDLPVMNAFALPGERIIVTSELIRRAGRAEQVAGVLAHELGHIAYRHPEAQLVRITGLQILAGTLSGGGNSASSIAGLAAILSYSREAEAEADDYAAAAMATAAIDPLGLREFFELALRQEGGRSTGTLARIRSVLDTHPGTAERIEKIHPLPDDVSARPVLSDKQWQALKEICD